LFPPRASTCSSQSPKHNAPRQSWPTNNRTSHTRRPTTNAPLFGRLILVFGQFLAWIRTELQDVCCKPDCCSGLAMASSKVDPLPSYTRSMAAGSAFRLRRQREADNADHAVCPSRRFSKLRDRSRTGRRFRPPRCRAGLLSTDNHTREITHTRSSAAPSMVPTASHDARA
jgi:hypothetical protein